MPSFPPRSRGGGVLVFTGSRLLSAHILRPAKSVVPALGGVAHDLGRGRMTSGRGPEMVGGAGGCFCCTSGGGGSKEHWGKLTCPRQAPTIYENGRTELTAAR